MLLRIGKYSQNLSVTAASELGSGQNTLTLACYMIFTYLLSIWVSKKLVAHLECDTNSVFPSFCLLLPLAC